MADWIPYAVDVAKRAANAPLNLRVSTRTLDMMGSSNAKRMRKQMRIPCVLSNTRPSLYFSVDTRDIVKQYRCPSWTTRVLNLIDEFERPVEVCSLYTVSMK